MLIIRVIIMLIIGALFEEPSLSRQNQLFLNNPENLKLHLKINSCDTSDNSMARVSITDIQHRYVEKRTIELIQLETPLC